MSELYFKNGKPKKSYMRCLSQEKIAELRRLYGRTIIQCAGRECPFYAVGCGRMELCDWEKEHSKNKAIKIFNGEV